MKLVVIGVNHKTAPVALRERLAFGDDLTNALTDLRLMTDGAVIVSTCNRSEIYAYVADLHAQQVSQTSLPVSSSKLDNPPDLVAWLANFKGVRLDEMLPFLYVYEGNRALTHWLRVAVGLDSMILGEPQILGQIKKAVAIAHQHHVITPNFDWLTQRIFGAARVVRRDTALGRQAVTLGFATAKLVTQIFDNPVKTTLMIVAAGEMNRLVAHNVATLGMAKILICNRSFERGRVLRDELMQMAQQAGRQVQIELCALDSLGDRLHEADIVSSCSGSMHALIDKAMVKSAMKRRKNRTMLMVDLAVPRDITPDVGNLDGVYLYSIDDLQHVIQGNLEERKQAAVEAEVLVGQLASGIEADMQVQAVGKAIETYQSQAVAHRDRLLQMALASLERGDDPSQVLQTFAHRLTKTLSHPPIRLLRQSAAYLEESTLAELSDGLLSAYRKT